MGPNNREALAARVKAGALTWRGPALMLFARPAFALVAQGVFALIFFLRGVPHPWLAVGPWLPVYGTLIDAGCLTCLWLLTRREGIRLFDLLGFERTRVWRDVLLGLALIPIGVALIYGGTAVAGLLVFGKAAPPYFFDTLPLPAAVYGVLVFPIVWGFTEQMTYSGYLAPRFQAVSRSTLVAVVCVGLVWSFQHAVMPLTFDAKFMAYRALSPLPFTAFQILLYLRMRRLLPFIVAHALMDGASVFIGVLLPLLKAQ